MEGKGAPSSKRVSVRAPPQPHPPTCPLALTGAACARSACGPSLSRAEVRQVRVSKRAPPLPHPPTSPLALTGAACARSACGPSFSRVSGKCGTRVCERMASRAHQNAVRAPGSASNSARVLHTRSLAFQPAAAAAAASLPEAPTTRSRPLRPLASQAFWGEPRWRELKTCLTMSSPGRSTTWRQLPCGPPPARRAPRTSPQPTRKTALST